MSRSPGSRCATSASRSPSSSRGSSSAAERPCSGEAGLAESSFLAGEALSLADVALVAYTRVAGEGGFDLAPLPRVRGWIARVEAVLGIG